MERLNKNRQNIKRQLLIPAFLVFCSLICKLLVLNKLPENYLFELDSFRYLELSKDFYSNYFSINSSPSAFETSPGFPFYLFLVGNLTPKNIITSQLLLLSIIQFLFYKTLYARFSFSSSITGLLVLIFESSININSFKILSETLILLLIALTLFFISKKSTSLHGQLVIGLILGCAILVKPIAQFIFLALVITLLLMKIYFRQFFLTVIICSSIFLGWSTYNLIKFNVPQISGIQSYNLLYYEGAGAKSFQFNSPLLIIQEQEMALEKEIERQDDNLADLVEYRQQRGRSLIFSNIKGFVEMHVSGVVKILLGPSNATTRQFLGELPFSRVTIIISFLFSVTTSLLMVIGSGFTMFWLSPKAILKRDFFLLFISISFVLLLAVSSGANAYSRFRVPLVPFQIYLLCYALEANLIKLPVILKRTLRLKTNSD